MAHDPSTISDDQAVSRRDFARRAVGVAAATAAGTTVATLVSAPLVAVVTDAGDATARADDEKPAPIRPPHELHLDLIRQRFPHEKLTPETLDLIRADIAGDLGRYRALDKYPLHNSDEPGFVFRVWRAEG